MSTSRLDARNRNKLTLAPSRVRSSSIPIKRIPPLLLSNVLFAVALHAGKDWLLVFDIGIFWVTLRILAIGGLTVIFKEAFTGELVEKKTVEWSVLGMSSVLLLVQQSSLLMALFTLPSIRVLLFTHFSAIWLKALWEPQTIYQTLSVIAAVAISFFSDLSLSQENFGPIIPAYGGLVLHALASAGLEHTQGILTPSLGSTFTTAASTLGACLLGLPLYVFRIVLLDLPSSPILPLYSWAALPLLAYSLLFLSPNTAKNAQQSASYASRYFLISYPSAFLFAAISGSLMFTQQVTVTDVIVASLLFYGMYPSDKFAIAGTESPRTPTTRVVRSHMKTILANPESRKIFYFLMLNMSYMGIQMLYGVWTNSLGLISDAIHMAFDCMAIGVGLFASIMATWEPNEQFTYGYARIETLSGFANGIFLILISIFIVFEAIQRILDPPDMTTNQLLLVSSLGLGVNLFGMFAMGGHHHHGGHSHSHGHSHSTGSKHSDHMHEANGHSHSLKSTTETFSNGSPNSPQQPYSPVNSSPLALHARPRSSSAEQSHSNGKPHLNDHSHGLEPSRPAPPPPASKHARSISHSHSHTAGEDHGHSHDSHSSSCTVDSNIPQQSRARQGHSRTLSLQVPAHLSPVLPPPPLRRKTSLTPTSPLSASPLTPAYQHGHDDHFDLHHAAAGPNANDPKPKLHTHEGHSHNMRGVFLHVMADTLGSVGVIISTLLIQFYGWTGFDPIASLFIAILIAASVIPLVIDTGKVLSLDVADREGEIQNALAELTHIEGLQSVSSPRFWPKDSASLIGSIHIHLAPSASSSDPTGPHSTTRLSCTAIDRVVEKVDSLLRSQISGLEDLTIQVQDSRNSALSPT